MKKFQKLSSILLIVISLVFIFGLIGCDINVVDRTQKIQASNLMHDIIAQPVNSLELDDQFCSAAANFSLDLFRATISNSDNSLISPVSVLLALAMTANGADGNTLTQMEQVIGGGMSINDLNTYLYTFVNNLTSQPRSLINISNSIWFREFGFTPNCEFLQTNANYFGADAFAAPFDNQTVEDINIWISNATDGLIKEMLDSIPSDAIMYLINTVLFDAEWARVYNEMDVHSGVFTNHNNQPQTAEFMSARENLLFIQDKNVTGFIKPYYGERYSFAAILPGEDINILDYIGELSGEDFLNLIGNAHFSDLMPALPKFSYEFEVSMNHALMAMGIEEAFCEERADLSRVGSASGNLFISDVKHKAIITVDEKGTKAGAATIVEVGVTSAPLFLKLDRPFIYAIIDNDTNLPLFIGTLLSIP
ncbi:MAG: serpin family protein [Treponema sp.]|jgi:serpin B|nr:serpin family protein [Treponema sp.]